MAHNKLTAIGAAGFILAAMAVLAQQAKPPSFSARQGVPSPATYSHPQNLGVPLVDVGHPTSDMDRVILENSGSTNTEGYKIDVVREADRSVNASYSYRDRVGHEHGKIQGLAVNKPLSARLYQDIETAGPLALLPVSHMVQSVSFGTSTYITYKGQRSPDLSYGSDYRVVALRNDVQAIAKLGHLGGPRRPLTR